MSKDTQSGGNHSYFQIQGSNFASSLLTADTVTGQILLPNANVSSTALLFGGDANLYRQSASNLKTDGTFESGGTVFADGGVATNMSTPGSTAFQARATGDTQRRFSMDVAGDIVWGSGFAVGDTQLYRSGAGSLAVESNTNSTTAFQIQNASASSFFTADASNFQVSTTRLQASSTVASTSGSANAQLSWNYLASSGLSMSGNEITDTTRWANTQGDGRTPPDSSTSIWEGTTNLVLNGGFESNTSFWNVGAYTRDTSVAKFGASSLKITTASNGAGGIWGGGNQTLNSTANQMPVTAGQTYTLSGWFLAPAGRALRMTIEWNGGSTTVAQALTATGSWQRGVLTATAPVGATSADVTLNGNDSSQFTLWVDGAQFEQKAYATPYVETNGATASRGGGRVQAPAALTNATTTWFAARIRYGVSSSSTRTYAQGIFDYEDNTNNRLRIYLHTNNSWYIERHASGSTSGVSTTTQTFNAGDIVTVVGYFTSTQIGLSINGGAFLTAGNTFIPTLAASQLDIGSGGPQGEPFDGDILWSAVGTGTLSNGDAVTLSGYGNSDPTITTLNTLNSGAASPTMAWNGVNSNYNTTSGTAQSTLTLDDASLYRGAANTLQTGSNFLLQSSSNSTTAFQVQNASGNQILAVDTTNGGQLHIIGGTNTGAGAFGNNESITQPIVKISGAADYLADNSGITTVLQLDVANRWRGQGTGAAIELGPIFGSNHDTSRIINYTDVGNTNGTRLQLQSHSTVNGTTWNSGIKLWENGATTVNYSSDPVSPPSTASLAVWGQGSNDLLQLQNASGFLSSGVDASGKLQFANGTGGAYDTNLYRSAAGTLQTDGNLTLGGSGQAGTLNAGTIYQSGILHLQGGRGSNGFSGIDVGISGPGFAGTTITSYDFSPGITLPAYFVKMNINSGNSGVPTADNAYSLALQNDGTDVIDFSTNGKILFGSAHDTNLYRSAASTLKTDGNLSIAGILYPSTIDGSNGVVHLQNGQFNFDQASRVTISSGCGSCSALTVNSTVSGNTVAGINLQPTLNTTGTGQNLYGQRIYAINSPANVDTVYGQYIGLSDTGTLANTDYGLYVDSTVSNSNALHYSAVFQGGNVGIGTASPSALLHVHSTANGPQEIVDTTAGWAGISLQRNSGGAGQQNWQLVSGAGGGTQDFSIEDVTGTRTSGNSPFYIQSGTNGHVLLDPAGGNVGIGTSSPNANLEIGTAGTSANAQLRVTSSGATQSIISLYNGGTSLGKLYSEQSTGNTYLYNTYAASLLLGTNNTTNVTIASGGATTFQNATDSTSAFTVKNTGGTQVLGADTTNLGVNVTNLQSSGTISLQGPDGGSILLRTAANSGVSGSSSAMTFSGNEITDKTRSADTQGDGRQPPDSSTGIWEATTNLVTNGGFETNTTGWTATDVGSTITRDTSIAKFGSASMKIVTNGGQSNQGAYITFPVTSGNAYTASFWINGNSMVGQQINVRLDITGTVSQSFTLVSGWQRLTYTQTATGTGTGDIQIRTPGTSAVTFWIDGVQFEQKAFATPYVETNGGTAPRSAASVQAPSTNLNSSGFWFASRVRVGALAPANQVIFGWRATDGTYYQMYLTGNGGTPTVQSHDASAYSTISQGSALTVGSVHTIIGVFSSTGNLGISVDGASYSTIANTHAPTLGSLPSTFDIGSWQGGASNQFDGDFLWTAAGTGTLSNADAASLYKLGNSDPSISGLNSIDSTSTPTFAWDGESTQYSGTNNTPTLQSGISIDDVNLYRSASGTLQTDNNFSVQGGDFALSGPANTNVIASITSSGTGGSFLQLISNGVASNELETTSGGDLLINSSGVAAGVVDIVHTGATANTLVLKTGNVGIGAASPNFGLTVYKDNGSGYAASFANASTSNAVGIGTFGSYSGLQGITSGGLASDLYLQRNGSNVIIGQALKIGNLQTTPTTEAYGLYFGQNLDVTLYRTGVSQLTVGNGSGGYGSLIVGGLTANGRITAGTLGSLVVNHPSIGASATDTFVLGNHLGGTLAVNMSCGGNTANSYRQYIIGTSYTTSHYTLVATAQDSTTCDATITSITNPGDGTHTVTISSNNSWGGSADMSASWIQTNN